MLLAWMGTSLMAYASASSRQVSKTSRLNAHAAAIRRRYTRGERQRSAFRLPWTAHPRGSRYLQLQVRSLGHSGRTDSLVGGDACSLCVDMVRAPCTAGSWVGVLGGFRGLLDAWTQ